MLRALVLEFFTSLEVESSLGKKLKWQTTLPTTSLQWKKPNTKKSTPKMKLKTKYPINKKKYISKIKMKKNKSK